MSTKEVCALIAEKSKVGGILAIIGHVLIIVDVIAVLIVLIPNPASYVAYLFLMYVGWIFLVIGVILSIVGVVRRNRHINHCTI